MKSKSIQFRVTEEQYNDINCKASENNMAVSDYVRSKIMSSDTWDTKHQFIVKVSELSNTVNDTYIIIEKVCPDAAYELNNSVCSLLKLIERK